MPTSKSLWLGFTPVSRGGAGQRTGCGAAMPGKGLGRWLASDTAIVVPAVMRIFGLRMPDQQVLHAIVFCSADCTPKVIAQIEDFDPRFCCTLPEARGLIRSRSDTMGLAPGTPDGPRARFSLRECIATGFPGLQRDVWEARSSGGPPILSLPNKAPARCI